MRILLATQFYPPIIGGEERHVRNLAAALVAKGHEVNVVTLWYPGASYYEMDGGVGVYRIRGTLQRFSGLFLESERRHAPPFPDPELVTALRRIITKTTPDVIHAHNWLLASIMPLKSWSGARLVVTLHDYSLVCARKNLMYEGNSLCEGPQLSKCHVCAAGHYGAVKGTVTTLGVSGYRYFARQSVDQFIAVSHAVARDNRLAETGVPFDVIPNFVPDNVSDLDPVEDPCLQQLPGTGFILFIGDIRRIKGADVLAKAYARLERAPPLVMIGRPLYNFPPDLPANVHVLGPWSHSAIMHAWHRCCFGVVPSVAPEACATVVMEGMASRKLIIASDIGGMPDMIDPGSTGILVPPDNVDALTKAIQSALDDPAMVARFATAALAGVERLKSTAVVSRIESVYQTLVQQSAAA
jgi:glycosyltransferase involved in cell wall biosynthesis